MGRVPKDLRHFFNRRHVLPMEAGGEPPVLFRGVIAVGREVEGRHRGPGDRGWRPDKRYGSTAAVDGILLEVGCGEIFGILGRNGAGKMTTVECLHGLRRTDGGRVALLRTQAADTRWLRFRCVKTGADR